MSEFLAMLSSTPLAAGNAPYVEAMYERFLEDPASIEPKWREFFAGLGGQPGDVPHGPLVEELARRAKVRRAGGPVTAGEVVVPGAGAAAKQGAVSRMIQIYANRGHLIANIDPLGLMERPVPKVLGLDYLGLGEADLDTEFLTGSRNEAIRPRLKLREIIAQLRHIYCGTIGAEFAHVSDETERLWLQDRFQVGRVQHRFPVEDRKDILWNLTMAEGLERYLATRYPAQKRFSLEGGDSLIPLLEDLIQTGGWVHGLEDIVIGMAHRGRLSVLVNVLGKSPAELFSEFEGNYDLKKLKGSGDVKYHKGFSCDVGTPGGNVHVALAFNPSHLEVVNPVVEGSVRARQERRGDGKGDKVMAVLIHGDSAFAGQGVIQETLQLSQTRAFYTGGTVHLIINNQVGFTTNDPRDTRSTLYCSDVAKMIEAPILHVNGDDPEAVVFAARLALEYRMKFHKDVVIDLVCYRRLGHNEADEPAATQPVMYAAIRRKPTTRQIYAEQLVNEGVIEQAEADAMGERYRRGLDEGKPQAHQVLGLIGNVHTVDWSRYHDVDWSEQVPTGVRPEVLRELGLKATTFPDGFTLHRQVQKVMDDRRRMAAGQTMLDWGFAETLAYATLLDQGYEIRLTGQDSGRGTFFHRHAVGPRPGERRRLHPAHEPQARAAALPRHRLAAVGGSSDGLRVRLLHRRPELPRDLGRAVRRLRERRPGDHRPVHQLGRGQVGPLLRTHSVPSARLRGTGPGALLGPARALPADVRREQHVGVRALDARADVPHAASADAARFPQAAHRHDAEEPVAPQAVGLGARGPHARLLPGGHRRDRRPAGRRGQARGVLLRQGLLRPARGATGRRSSRRGHRAARAALSVPGRGLRRRDPSLSQCARDRVVPGRAAEPGRVVPGPPPPAGAALAQAGAALLGAGLRGRAGGRYPPASQHPAERPRGRCDQGQRQRRVGALDVPPARHRHQEEFMTIEVRVPQLPESVADATLVAWHKKPGDAVQRDENLVDLETDKVVLEVPAPTAGVIKELMVQDGATVTSGQVLALLEEGAAATAAPAAKGAAAAAKAAAKAGPAAAKTGVPPEKLAPSVRRLVEEHKLDAGAIPGSGRDGRVTKGDVLAHVAGQEPATASPEPGAANLPPAGRQERRVPMTRLRTRIAERLVQAQATAAMLTTFNEVDLKAVNELRARYRDRFEKEHGARLGFMSFFVKACVEALKRFPVVNASVDGSDIVYHEYYDIGVAVSTDRGLLVPVLRDADVLGFGEIEKTVVGFATRAREGSITLEELTGGTFTITNGGVFGSLLSTPILNMPQSAILGMHKIQERPVVVDGQVVVRPMMYLALSYDHRLIDGREAVQFLVAIKDALEDPARLLLQV